MLEDYREEPNPGDAAREQEEQTWREAIYEIALEQVLADETIAGRARQVFVRVAVNGEKPEAVAEAFGINRNAVDQIKSRMIEKLRGIVAQLEPVDAAIG